MTILAGATFEQLVTNLEHLRDSCQAIGTEPRPLSGSERSLSDRGRETRRNFV